MVYECVCVDVILYIYTMCDFYSRSSIGDNVDELVDGDFDDESDDEVDEQSIGNEIRDLAENLLWIKRAVKTSSFSSISESDSLFDADADGRGSSLPAARKFCSNSSNWPIKFRFGEMIGRANFTNLYASNSDSDLYRIT